MREGFKVGIVGSGYVGLMTGACLSFLGHRVRYYMRAGEFPGYRLGVGEVVERGVHRKRAWKRWLIAMERIPPVQTTHPTVLTGKESS